MEVTPLVSGSKKDSLECVDRPLFEVQDEKTRLKIALQLLQLVSHDFEEARVPGHAISALLAFLTSLSQDPQLVQSIDHDSRPETMTLSEAIRLRILGLWTEVTAELPPDASLNESEEGVGARAVRDRTAS